MARIYANKFCCSAHHTVALHAYEMRLGISFVAIRVIRG
jgi:hypothetical protein